MICDGAGEWQPSVLQPLAVMQHIDAIEDIASRFIPAVEAIMDGKFVPGRAEESAPSPRCRRHAHVEMLYEELATYRTTAAGSPA